MSAKPRDRSIDVAKGIAIIAIVLGHVLRGNAGADIVDGRGPLFDELDTALYAVHLPVFAFLSGLFVRRAVERDGRQTYLRSRLTLFAYLYVLWTVLQGAVKLVTGSLANSPLTARGLAESLWLPDTQMWFLPFLALVTCASVVVPPWGDRTRLALGTLVALVVSGVAWGLNGAVAGSQGLGLAVFFWVGVVVGPEGVSRLRCRPKVLLAAGGAVFVGVLALSDPVVATSSHEPRSLATSGLGVIASVAGVVAVLCLGQVLDRGPVAGWLVFLGSVRSRSSWPTSSSPPRRGSRWSMLECTRRPHTCCSVPSWGSRARWRCGGSATGWECRGCSARHVLVSRPAGADAHSPRSRPMSPS